MRNRQAGYALLIVMLLAALVLIGLSVAVPPIFTQGQREKEEELIFRGQQYQRAVGLFYKKFGRFPNSIEELLRTNERSFLRRPFPDPMTAEGKWRLIRVGAAGQFIGSVNKPVLPGSPGTTSPEAEAEEPATASPPSPPPGESSGATTFEPIVGVASRSTARAFKVYEGYTQYHQWEFIYDPVKEAVGVAPGAPTQGAPTQPTEPKSPP